MVSADAIAKAPPPKPKVYLPPSKVKAYLDRLGPPAPGPLKQHADSLRLPVRSLEYFGVRYDGARAVLVFPMWDRGKVVGCRMRRQDARKWSLKGGRDGVFRGFPPDRSMPLIVTEGPTDGAAAVASGLSHVMGRSNCWCGGGLIRDYLQSIASPNLPVVILSDPNEVGREGSRELAIHLPNPTIVLVSRMDVRTYVISVRANLVEQIILALEGREDVWHVMFRNMRYVAAANRPGYLDRIYQCLRRDYEQYGTRKAS